MRKLTELCTVTLAAVAFAAAPAAASETDSWPAPTTPHDSTTTGNLCAPDQAETDGVGSGAESARGAISVSPPAVGEAGPAGSLSVPPVCEAVPVARVGSVPDGGATTGNGRWTGSGNAAVLFVAGVGAMAVTGSAVVAHRRTTGIR